MRGSRRRVAAVVATVAVVAAGIGAVLIQPRAIDTCIQVYEDAGGAGDTMTVCDTPANLKVPNLGTVTTGLHNGCNRGINQSSSWSDCISSARVTHLTANNKAVFFQDTSYSGQVWCIDADGDTGPFNFTGGANDVISSFRVLGGNC